MEKKENHRRKYSDDFKQKIVNEFMVSKQTLNAFSHQKCIDSSILSRWVKMYRNECRIVPVAIDSKTNLERDIIALKKELASVKETVAVLKKILEKTFAEKYTIISEVNSEKE
jgi:transposase-like protein